MSTALAKAKEQMASRRAHIQDIDRYVGERLRVRRIMLGLTQQQLAELIGVTYQQAHKYEKGINRLAAGRLYKAAQVLGTDVSYFFEGVDGGGEFEPTPQQRMLLELAKNFIGIPTHKHQQAVSFLVRTLSSSEGLAVEESPEEIPEFTFLSCR